MPSSIINLILVFLLLLPATLHAQEDTNWPEGSAMHTGQIWSEKHAYFLDLLEKRHNALVQAASSIADNERIVKAITAQHHKWLEYYQAECALIGTLTGAGGSWPSTYTMQCMANLVDKRFRRVSAAQRCIEKIPAEQRTYEQQRCFYQLAPLALHE